MPPAAEAVYLTVADVAARYTVREQTVLAWIARGELVALNVGRKPGKKRPRWRISPEAVTDFEHQRSTLAAPASMPSERRTRRDPKVFRFVT